MNCKPIRGQWEKSSLSPWMGWEEIGQAESIFLSLEKHLELLKEE